MSEQAKQKKPNVLLICADHWSSSLFSALGHPVVETPTLDQIAKNGVRFTNAYSECPVCVPARRTLMTGQTAKLHGDRIFKECDPMPEGVTTMAQAFRNGGYQAYAVGKLHVYPQRDRIGFDDVILEEEGRTQYGAIDDYELFLGDQGYVGRQYDHGMSNNTYETRPWHLPEETHATNWATQQMVRTIKRRDPNRPAFWYLGYRHPHPPLLPLTTYLDYYRNVEMDKPQVGEWAKDTANLPFCLTYKQADVAPYNDHQREELRRAFYALCTHIDHQIRIIIGTLREEGELDNTIICFTSDHGDMLGAHNLIAKRLMYEESAKVPMIIMGAKGDKRVDFNQKNDKLVGWQDIMPTLLDLAGLDVPKTVSGMSMFGESEREHLYGEVGEDDFATRMIRRGKHKLIYYPVGNHLQLFNLEDDPLETMDLARDPACADVMSDLTERLIGELYNEDLEWVQDGKLAGKPDKEYKVAPNRSLYGQRGQHWPFPPKTNLIQWDWLDTDT